MYPSSPLIQASVDYYRQQSRWLSRGSRGLTSWSTDKLLIANGFPPFFPLQPLIKPRHRHHRPSERGGRNAAASNCVRLRPRRHAWGLNRFAGKLQPWILCPVLTGTGCGWWIQNIGWRKVDLCIGEGMDPTVVKERKWKVKLRTRSGTEVCCNVLPRNNV